MASVVSPAQRQGDLPRTVLGTRCFDDDRVTERAEDGQACIADAERDLARRGSGHRTQRNPTCSMRDLGRPSQRTGAIIRDFNGVVEDGVVGSRGIAEPIGAEFQNRLLDEEADRDRDTRPRRFALLDRHRSLMDTRRERLRIEYDSDAATTAAARGTEMDPGIVGGGQPATAADIELRHPCGRRPDERRITDLERRNREWGVAPAFVAGTPE